MTTTETRPDLYTRRQVMAYQELLDTLKEKDSRKKDYAVYARDMRVTDDGTLLLRERGEAVLSADGVGRADVQLEMLAHFDTQVAGKLSIPYKYYARMRAEATTDSLSQHDKLRLLAANINAWLAENPDRVFVVRSYSARGSEPAVARALLSDRFRIQDDLQVFAAACRGITEAGLSADQVRITGELTERRLHIRMVTPAVTADASPLLVSYKSPFSGKYGHDFPLMSAGLELSNSEVGCGASTLLPYTELQVCSNGMTINVPLFREEHRGSQIKPGIVKISDATKLAELELISRQTTDAVATCLDSAYLAKVINDLARDAGVAVPPSTIGTVLEELRPQVGYTVEQQQDIFNHFLTAGAHSAAGIMHAMTSVAQTVTNPDDARTLEAHAIPAMRAAAELLRV